MKKFTRLGASIVLKEAGEYWTDVSDLKRIYNRTYDPIIKDAAQRLITALQSATNK